MAGNGNLPIPVLQLAQEKKRRKREGRSMSSGKPSQRTKGLRPGNSNARALMLQQLEDEKRGGY
jgi:hypothetical protein